MADIRTQRWVENYARLGFVAKGIVYLMLGVLALRAALGTGGRITAPHGVVSEILDSRHGTVLVAVLAVGLAGYSLWRFIEAFGDANRKGKNPSSVVVRAGYAFSGSVYGLLAFDAARLVLGAPGGPERSHVLRFVLGGPLGGLLVVLVALGLLGYAGHQFLKAVWGQVDDELNLAAAPRPTARWVTRITNFGTGARAVVFALVSVLLIRAAATPASAAGVDTGDALRFAAGLPEGRWWLAFVALGFAAYGLEQFVQAFYRRITAPRGFKLSPGALEGP